jgi:ABC-type cobalamin/Fe3+-siderophores transport system ATPase subunit
MRHAIFDIVHHRLSTEKIIKKESKQGFEVIAFQALKALPMTIYQAVSSCPSVFHRLTQPSRSGDYSDTNNNNPVAGIVGKIGQKLRSKLPQKLSKKGGYEMLPAATKEGDELSTTGAATDTDEISDGEVDDNDDDLVTLELGGRSRSRTGSHHDERIAGKVTCRFLNNTPTLTSSSSKQLSQSSSTASKGHQANPYASHSFNPSGAVFFRATGLNVLSGEKPLFGSNGLDLSLRCGEIMTIEGPSGLGKTRLLRAIAQLDCPLTGEVSLTDTAVAAGAEVPSNKHGSLPLDSDSSSKPAEAHVMRIACPPAVSVLPASSPLHPAPSYAIDSSSGTTIEASHGPVVSDATTSLANRAGSFLSSIYEAVTAAHDLSIPSWRRRVIYVPQVR